MLAKTPMQRIEINILNGRLVPGSVGPVLPSPALGLPHACPVGGPVSGARKTVALDKALQQINAVAIFGLPIAAEAPGHSAQNIAGQLRHPDPGKDEKTGVVRDPMKVLRSHRPRPTNVIVPCRTLPSRRTKEPTSQGTTFGIPDQVLQIFPDRTLVAQIMMLVQQRIEHRTVPEAGLARTRTFQENQR